MKKTLSIGLGLAFLGASIISFAGASRDAYQNYLYSQSQETRGKMRRISAAPFRPFAEQSGKVSDSRRLQRGLNLRGQSHGRNMIAPLAERAVENAESPRAELRLPRSATDRTYAGWQTSLNRRGVLAFEKINDAVEVFETYENQAFSVQIPEGWFASMADEHFFRSRLSDFTVSIKKIENACSSVSFTTCAITLSNNENYKNPAEKIVNNTTIERKSYFSDTILNKDIQTRVVTESFIGQFTGEEKFISRAFVAGLDGSVYLIETRTNPRSASRFIGVTKKIFDSFRIFEEPLTE